VITNYEGEAFLSSLRDEEQGVRDIVRHIFNVLDDANNPDLAGARKRLMALMQRDEEIGKHQSAWRVVASWLQGPAEANQREKPKTKVIENLGVTPP